MFDIEFFIRAGLLGVGLAMDACAVSMANGFREPEMKIGKIALVAGFFGIFQFLMPLISYFAGSAIISVIAKAVPYAALLILGFIGVKTLIGGLKQGDDEMTATELSIGGLAAQAIATSLDALAVGFTIADYTVIEATVCTGIIGIETFIISVAGVYVGKRFGTKLGSKAEIAGGLILIAIGIEIFLKGIL